jgi:hypothetical protein
MICWKFLNEQVHLSSKTTVPSLDTTCIACYPSSCRQMFGSSLHAVQGQDARLELPYGVAFIMEPAIHDDVEPLVEFPLNAWWCTCQKYSEQERHNMGVGRI